MKRNKKKYLTIIVPFHNEASNLTELHQELIQKLVALKKSSEIIYVDDGSTDLSVKVLLSAIKTNKRTNIRIKLIRLRARFGQTAALNAGLDEAKGAFIGFMDADLQNDPADIARFIKEINKGYDVVFGWRKDRQDPSGRSIASWIANAIIRYVFKVPLHDVGCSIKIYRKEIIAPLKFYGETHRILSVLTIWSGVRFSELPVNHRPRLHGSSKYGYSRILKIIIDLLTAKFLSAYSTKPAYIFGTFGLITIFLSGLCLIIVAYHKIFEGVFVHRDPLFVIAMFFMLAGLQFFCFGLLAELQIRTYFESQKKKVYDIKEIIVA